MSSNSVFTNDKGKYATAVYFCEVRGSHTITEDWVAKLFPTAFGYSVALFHFTVTPLSTRWYMLICNTRQTTRADIAVRLEKAGVHPHDYTVSVESAVYGRGSAKRVGTPRSGTVRKRANTVHGVGVVAR